MQNYLPQYRSQLSGYKVLPISSELELNNITVDFNGTPTYFHNQNANEIYVKQFDIKTGLTLTQKFIKSDNAGHEITGVKSDFDINTYEEKLNALNDRINGLEEKIEKGGKK